MKEYSCSTNDIHLVFGGDVSFDLEVRQCNYLGAWRLAAEGEKETLKTPFAYPKGSGRKISHRIMGKLNRIWKAIKISGKVDPPFIEPLMKTSENRRRMYLDQNFRSSVTFDVAYPDQCSKFAYPFEKISNFFHGKDFVMVNLESPLTSHPRPYGLFISDPSYAQAMADAGITMVNLANNHIFDAGEIGFLHTIKNLNQAGILYTGAGKNLRLARLGTPITIGGARVTFLGYTQFCNNRFCSVAAEYPGILPMDSQLMAEDVSTARQKTDLVFVSLHWGFENTMRIHPKQREIAHLLIDRGADGIIGHHPHVPQGIEIYKNRPILYSLGNFIFGQSDIRWNIDNFLAEFVVKQKEICEVIVHPVSGQGEELFQPEILCDVRAERLLEKIQSASAGLGAVLEIRGFSGTISMG